MFGQQRQEGKYYCKKEEQLQSAGVCFPNVLNDKLCYLRKQHYMADTLSCGDSIYIYRGQCKFIKQNMWSFNVKVLTSLYTHSPQLT